eukprot:4669009-Pyramimonas_sp.AAC.1
MHRRFHVDVSRPPMPTVGSRRFDRRRPRRGRSRLNAAGDPESANIQRSGDRNAADRSQGGTIHA